MSFAIYVCPVNPEEAYDDYVSFPQFTLFFFIFPGLFKKCRSPVLFNFMLFSHFSCCFVISSVSVILDVLLLAQNILLRKFRYLVLIRLPRII